MDGYVIINLRDMVQAIGEDKTSKILSDFQCPMAPDVECFLRQKALQFHKSAISSTFLVFTSYKNENVLVGYYALANKVLTIQAGSISQTIMRRIEKFGEYDALKRVTTIPSPLIGQLGKNFYNSYDQLISGDELLSLALDSVKQALSILSGKTVYIECENNQKLVDFYSRNGFVLFWNRKLDRDETGLKGDHLYQLIKYLK